MRWTFSCSVLVFLSMMIVPNLLWTKVRTKGYVQMEQQESRVIVALERIGQVAMSACALFENKPPRSWLWLVVVFGCMGLYELYWTRYFRSHHTLQDFYRDLGMIPIPGAVLPVAAGFSLAVYGRNPFLLGATMIFGIGHVGIHWRHRQERK